MAPPEDKRSKRPQSDPPREKAAQADKAPAEKRQSDQPPARGRPSSGDVGSFQSTFQPEAFQAGAFQGSDKGSDSNEKYQSESDQDSGVTAGISKISERANSRQPSWPPEDAAPDTGVPTYPEGAVFEPELNALIRVSAWAGAGLGTDDCVNYNTLLIGLALCSDPTSQWFRRAAADKGFRRDALLASRLKPTEVNEVLRKAGQGMPQIGNPYSSSAQAVLSQASEMARIVWEHSDPYENTRLVGTRHLMAALLLSAAAAHVRDLEEWGIDAAGLRLPFLRFVRRGWDKERRGWNALHAQHNVPGAAQESDSRLAAERLVATFGADDPGAQARDLLDVGNEARAFARIAASRSTHLPLSIGVFGEWGSGKTFFMGRVYEHVEELSQRAREEADRGDQKSMFLSDIVQIKFNAWHYIETNLWASLVEYIFSELDRCLQSRNKPKEQVEAVFEQLSTSRHLKLEAIRDLISKRRERKSAEQRLDTARRDYEAGQLRQSAVTSSSFWLAVFNTFQGSPDGKAALAQAQQLGDSLGLGEVSKSVQSLHGVLQEAETEAGRAAVLHRAMTARLGQWRWVVAIVLVLLLVPVAAVWLKEALAGISALSWLDTVNNAVLTVSSALAAAAGLIGTMVGRTRNVLKRLEAFRVQLDGVVRQQTDKFNKDSKEAQSFADVQREVARLRNELEQAERRFAEADKRADDAFRDYQGSTARGRLNSFIREKIAGGAYAKHLGLIATIRKDFQQLAQLMSEIGDADKSRKKYEEALAEYKKTVDKLLAQAEEGILSLEEREALKVTEEIPQSGLFTRIILYIDDLDRCPADKVVDVLQAIHLLLYFPLFVVVVAVDARWVSRSLREQYPNLLTENIAVSTDTRASGKQNADPDNAADVGPGSADRRTPSVGASSHDYLEKIFQIPYWVRAMDEKGSMDYVGGIAEPDLEKQSVWDAPGPSDAGKVVGDDSAHNVTGTPATPKKPDSIQVDAVSDPAPESPKAVWVARSMSLSAREGGFLQSLAPFVGSTPRRGLRFVNVYRLVKTSLSEVLEDELLEYGSSELGYRALITQIAVVTGAPHLAWSYFKVLEEMTTPILALRSQPSRGSSAPQQTAGLGVSALRSAVGTELSWADGDEKRALLGALERLEILSTEDGVDVGSEMLIALNSFAAIARRYSFTARPH